MYAELAAVDVEFSWPFRRVHFIVQFIITVAHYFTAVMIWYCVHLGGGCVWTAERTKVAQSVDITPGHESHVWAMGIFLSFFPIRIRPHDDDRGVRYYYLLFINYYYFDAASKRAWPPTDRVFWLFYWEDVCKTWYYSCRCQTRR